MNVGLVLQAVGLFAGTNVDDIVVLALLFSRAANPDDERRVILGQYLGFAAILLVAVLGALGAGLLPEPLIRLLGLVPLGMGLRLGWAAWRERGTEEPDGFGVAVPVGSVVALPHVGGSPVLGVAAITACNGGDDIGVYVPAFAASGTSALLVYVPVFLALVGVWCAAGRYVATRPVIATSIARRGHILLPVVLVAIGLVILLG